MNEKGVTLTTLIIVIIVLSMIAGASAVKVSSASEQASYNKLKEDLITLRESVSQIYGDSDSLENIGPIYTGDKSFLKGTQGDGQEIRNVNDNDVYYVIDANKLDSDLQSKYNIHLVKLNYGKSNFKVSSSDTSFSSNDTYIINEKSRTIYYNKGIKYNGKKYYREVERYTEVKKTEFVDEQNISKWTRNHDVFEFNYDNISGITEVTVKCNNADNWEIIYLPINNLNVDKDYQVSIDVRNDSGSTARSSEYNGAGLQILNKVEDSDNLTNSVSTKYLSNTANGTFTTATTDVFTASQPTMYLALNFGMLKDDATYTFMFKDILVQEK